MVIRELWFGPAATVLTIASLGALSLATKPDTSKLDKAIQIRKEQQRVQQETIHRINLSGTQGANYEDYIRKEIKQILRENPREAHLRLKKLLNSGPMIDHIGYLNEQKINIGDTPNAEDLIRCLVHCYGEIDSNHLLDLANTDNSKFWLALLSYTNASPRNQQERIITKTEPVA